ncbi:MAG: response regulator transcription factor [Nitrospira sp.]|jgi:DNA-binding NarL/FixJ family response regulator|nr:response regulator transcription factor [Nitrospira sp.]
MPIRVVLADDHVLIRAGLRALLHSLPNVQVVGEASDGHEAVAVVEKIQPDVVIMDIAMANLNGLEAASRITRQWPKVRVIILSMHANEEYVGQALNAGATGYLLKGAEPAELELALKAAVRGETYLSPSISKPLVLDYLEHRKDKLGPAIELTARQREVLQLIAEGCSTKDIARKLGVSVKTVDSHRTELMRRLDIHDVAGLVRYAIRRGLVSTDA